MVVDDDIEIVQYLKLLLSTQYKVICRFNATSAFETLQREENIDLIISDVIMPEVSGYQLCKQIKDDVRYSHIPVILVTAKNSVKDQVEGLNNGALAYVTKPFDPDYLMAVILSLLQNRDASRKLLQEGTLKTKLDGDDSLTAQDKAFMKELYKLMEEELDNPDMDIVRLTEMMRVSRSKLYYKIKALVGENPASFFKHYKLNRAAEMIREGKYNISEIAQLTGFSNQSYFTACFKKQFGVTPKEYV
jgi:DNA-binding NtrC family response regulator